MFQRPPYQEDSVRGQSGNVHGVPSAPRQLSEARFQRFMYDFQEYKRRRAFFRTMDAVLDLYSQWKRTKDKMLSMRIVFLLFELRRLDPAFTINVVFPEKGEKR